MKYVALVVCHNAGEGLVALVKELKSQTLAPYKILIIDNNSDNETQTVLNGLKTQQDVDIKFHNQNLGGAGGFKAGFEAFNSEYPECDYLITFDDDASAQETDLCESLVQCAEANPKHCIGSVVIDINDHSLASFSYNINNKSTRVVKDILNHTGDIDDIKLFSGVIFPRCITEQFPGPRAELFICGDEQELKVRMQKAGVLMKTSRFAKCYHPNSAGHTKAWAGIRVFSEDNQGKYYFLVRNWVYLMKNHPTHSTYVRTRILVKTFVVNSVYTIYKAVKKNNVSLLKFWSAFSDGVLENFKSRSSKSAVAYLSKARKPKY